MNERDLFFKRVQEDLSPFRDPGTVLEVEQKGAQLRVSWLQRRKKMSAVFTYEIGHQDVEFEEAKYSYRSFFAGDQMADIAGIAQSSFGLHSIPEYVATTAAVALSTGEVEEDGDAIEVIARVSQGSDLSRASTGFVMVTAGAGAGKTRTLRELVARQAKQYLAGASSYVYLYVDAQGRALAKFHEALSTELNDLRVSLPYHAVAVLVRMGLVVPVIDGFDELIGVGGYDDAFSSIASFVDDLEGMGCIVASARSTYYEQEFLSRSSRRSENSSQSWELATVEVKGWGDVQRENYLHALIPVDADRRSRIRTSVVKAFAGVNAQLADKPLFYVSVAKLFAEDESIVLGGTSLLQSLVEVFLIRECREKLLDRNSNNILDVKQLSSLVSDLAEEMWSQSTRELEKQTVKELAELSVMGPDVAEASAAIVVERMPSMAFLKRGESAGSVAFEHELFFDYFLSDRLVLRLRDVGPHSVVALGRSAMPQSLAEQVASKQLAEGGDVPVLVQSLVKIVASPSMRRLQVAENAGKLIGELVVRNGSISGAKLVDVIFPGSSLAGVSFDGVAFSGCIFRRVGLAATKFGDCVFSATQFEAPLVSAETRFSNCVGLDESNFFSGLRSSDSDGKVRTVARPDDVRTLLSHMGVLTETNVLQLRDVSTEAVALVERMLRICARCNPVAFEDEQFRTIGQSSLWPQVRRIAMDSGVFKVESGVQTRGPGKEFLRRTVSVEDLWAGLVSSEVDVPDASKIFWTRLEEEFPANSESN